MSSKMASKMVNLFFQSPKFCTVGSYEFVQIQPACGPIAYEIMLRMEKLEAFHVNISNGKIKYPIEKSLFAVKLQLKHQG